MKKMISKALFVGMIFNSASYISAENESNDLLKGQTNTEISKGKNNQETNFLGSVTMPVTKFYTDHTSISRAILLLIAGCIAHKAMVYTKVCSWYNKFFGIDEEEEEEENKTVIANPLVNPARSF